MRSNAKDKFRKATDELCHAQNHLNLAYSNVENKHNKTEIHAALKAVASALENAHSNLINYKD
ncbi:hypothetical protein [Clostridium tarantellae]|uniref:Uncharacterized protein n=1 Tax=Clostridium tarantellae TaxID=39493 RepID=A0A6I1MJZ3_9CLOT|nr:hypothetical protein [Clostridium tarantellae]MPQ43846.1 hypothetical protein [Clostridium tarantellae]